jgi:tRNA-dihydrouridine synthase B
MNIGKVKLDNPTVLAPLAGITNLPFRLLAKEAGCALVYSEMVSANGLVYKSAKTKSMLDSSLQEKPLAVQIFGSDPSVMAEAAGIVQSSGADILDINFGCSVKKVLKTGSGSALMKDPDKAEAIIKSVRSSIKIPLTIKIRTGWETSGSQAIKISKIAESCGVDAIAVHPRTTTQGFGGKADWSVIKAVKKAVTIPVIGNGDIAKPEDAVQMKKETNCNAVMIGRAAIGNPWIFSQIISVLNGDNYVPVDMIQRFDGMIHYLNSSVAYLGEERACKMMRSRLGWFVKGLPGSSHFRGSLTQVFSQEQVLDFIDSYRNELQNK